MLDEAVTADLKTLGIMKKMIKDQDDWQFTLRKKTLQPSKNEGPKSI